MVDNSNMGLENLKFSDIKLAVVCPMANEHDTAVDFVNAVLEKCRGFKQATFFAVLDNKCTDGTFDLLKKLQGQQPQLNVLWAPENRCVVDAYIRGYQQALVAGSDWILEIDAGFSHQPSDIPLFLEKMSAGFDCVFGSRFCQGGTITESPLKRRIISFGGSILTNILLGTRLKDMTSGFEMFTSQALRMILDKGIKSRGHFFQTEIKVYCKKLRIIEVPINYRAPSASVNSAVLKDAVSNLFRLVRLRLVGKL